MKLTVGISTCPNDTFAFHSLLEGAFHPPNIDLQFELLDIDELNHGLISGRFSVAKASYFAALKLADQVMVLPAGSALGFGVGPLLLKSTHEQAFADAPVCLVPGEFTTANLLFQLFHGSKAQTEVALFSDIMPAVSQGHAAYGVCIHEGRFTWQQYEGLALEEDLGEHWETVTGSPLPLGGLFASKSLPRDGLIALNKAIRLSIEFSRSQPEAALPTMRKYAQEMADDVLMQHVDLYVNDWTVDLGDTGRSAIAALANQARQAGLLGAERELEVLS